LAHAAAAGDQDFTAAVLVDDLAIGRLFTGPHADDTAGLFARTGPGGTTPAVHLVGAARDLARGDLDGGLTRLRRAEQALGPIPPHPAADAPGGMADPCPAGDPPERAGDPSDGPVPRAAARLSCALLRALAARLAGGRGSGRGRGRRPGRRAGSGAGGRGRWWTVTASPTPGAAPTWERPACGPGGSRRRGPR